MASLWNGEKIKEGVKGRREWRGKGRRGRVRSIERREETLLKGLVKWTSFLAVTYNNPQTY